MGLNVKEGLVILKCPKRGAFLLSREKLKNITNKNTHEDCTKFVTLQKSIHIGPYLCFIITGEWVIIRRSEISNTCLLLSFDVVFNADGDVIVTFEQISIFFEFYLKTENKTLTTPGSYVMLNIFFSDNAFVFLHN